MATEPSVPTRAARRTAREAARPRGAARTRAASGRPAPAAADVPRAAAGTWRLVVVFGVAVACLLGGAGWLVRTEIRQGPALRERAAREELRVTTLRAERGSIVDSRGRVLAASIRRPSVFADPALVRNFAFEAAAVAEALDLDPHALEAELLAHRDKRFRWVERYVSDEEESAVRRLLSERLTRAFGIEQEPKRTYPQGRVAAHLLGFVGADDNGLAGVEFALDERLRGRPGRRVSRVDARSRRVQSLPEEFVAPVNGSTLVLTIDLNVQQRVERHLAQAVAEFDAEWGTALVMDPLSGELLASAVVPDFDPARPIPRGARGAALRAAEQRLRNRVVADAYEPGSIFKPFIAGPAVDEGLVRIDEPFAINGPVRMWRRRPIHDTHAYSTLRLFEVIGHSSNIGMGLLGDLVGNQRLHEYVRRFGFGDPTGLDLPGEHGGLLAPLRDWTSFSTQSIPIGQEISATPIQILTAFSAFCNGGILYRPRVVRGVIAADGRIEQDRSRPIAVRRVLTAEGSRLFREEALRFVLTHGNVRHLNLEDYAIFGKTGTAQIARREGGGYEEGAYVGSFVCGAPVEQPRVAVLVSLFHPRGGKYYGGTVAAPTAVRITAETLAYLRVRPALPEAGPDALE